MTHDHRHHRHELAAISHDMDELEALVLLAELERDVIALEAAADRNVPDATRPLSKAEWDAGVRFGVIDARTQRLADDGLAATNILAQRLADAMETELADAGSVADVQARTAMWASPLIGSLPAGVSRDDVSKATAGVQDVLTQAWDGGAADVRAEYEYQGAAGLPDVGPAIPPSMVVTLAGAALAVVTHRVSRMLGVAATTARETAVTDPRAAAQQVVTAARTVSTDGTRDLARQGVHQATAAARAEQASSPRMPAIKEIYASELLDRRTCDPCGAIDGSRYGSLDEARVDYREQGGFRQCEGGLRCRGTLVFVHASESEPTLQTPGDVPPPAGTSPAGPASPSSPGGGGNPPSPPRVGRFAEDPTGPQRRPAFDDLDTDGLIDEDISRLAGYETDVARWQEQASGVDLRSVRPRAEMFPHSEGFATPDVVDVISRRTFEYASSSSAKTIRVTVRDKRRQSANLLLLVESRRSPMLGAMGDELRKAAARYGAQYDSMTLLWRQPGGPIEQLPWRS